MSEFLQMGGYAAYVWSAYALAAVVLVWNIRSAVVAHREAKLRAERALAIEATEHGRVA